MVAIHPGQRIGPIYLNLERLRSQFPTPSNPNQYEFYRHEQ